MSRDGASIHNESRNGTQSFCFRTTRKMKSPVFLTIIWFALILDQTIFIYAKTQDGQNNIKTNQPQSTDIPKQQQTVANPQTNGKPTEKPNPSGLPNKAPPSNKTPHKPSERKGHLRPIGESGNMKPLSYVHGFVEPVEFYKEYVSKSVPVLMKEAAKLIPAYHAWSDNYFRTRIPDGVRGLVDVAQGKKEERQEGGKQMHFTEFLDAYNHSDIYMVQDVPSFLQHDFILPWSIQCPEYQSLLFKSVMWFSSGGTKSVFHNEGLLENINCLIRGQNRFVMMDFKKYGHMDPTILDVYDVYFTHMDVEKVDLDKYPIMENAEFYEAVMEPGDCLYIPIKWFHHVASVGSNLAVDIWWSQKNDLKLNGCKDKFDNSFSFDTLNFAEHPTAITQSSIISKLLQITFLPEEELISMETFMSAFDPEVTQDSKLELSLRFIFKLLDANNDQKLNKENEMLHVSKSIEERLQIMAEKFDSHSAELGLDIFLTEPIPVPTFSKSEEDSGVSIVDPNIYLDLDVSKADIISDNDRHTDL